MKKVFFALLFLSVAGAGILVWLIRSAPPAVDSSKEHSLQIVDEKHEEAGKAAEKAEGHDEEGEGEEGGHGEHGEAAEGDAPSEHAAAPAGAHGASEHGEAEHKDEHAEEKHGEAADKHEEAKVSGPALNLSTEPPMAKVWVDGKYRGTTPLEIALKARSQKIEIKSDGFEDFSKTAPSVAESGSGELNWRIQLKQSAADAKSESDLEHAAEEAAPHGEAAHGHKPAPKAKHAVEKHATEPHAAEKHAPKKAAPSAHAESHGLYRRGKTGPFVVQFKSLPRLTGEEASIQGQIARYRQELGNDDKIFGCPIDLKEKGPWVRILAGPFPSRAIARERLEAYKKNAPDAFVAGGQSCLP